MNLMHDQDGGLGSIYQLPLIVDGSNTPVTPRLAPGDGQQALFSYLLAGALSKCGRGWHRRSAARPR
jgi:hypothetical protein